MGCKLERSREWAVRCVNESQMHTYNCWDTLTYNDANLPEHGDLNYPDVQKFLKRVRKRGYNIRYYGCGEYGETTKRPHYHICLFGHTWLDRKPYQANYREEMIYTSQELTELWGLGDCKTAELSFDNAAYTARYCTTKITGRMAEEHYSSIDEHGEYYTREPEYNFMSLKPGIGATWLDKYKTDVYPHDYIVHKGIKSSPPKYYDKLLEAVNEKQMADIREMRLEKAHERRHDNTWQRLAVKEAVTKAAISNIKRSL